ncbi:MAG: hypothetical protein AAGB93_05010 [Planctomycetota bacterium]
MITTPLLPSLAAALAPLSVGALPPQEAAPSEIVPPHLEEEPLDLSYTFLEVGATTTDLSRVDGNDLESYYLRGSLALGAFQIVGEYERADFEFTDPSYDLYRLGLGAHGEIAPRLDLQGDVSWLYVDPSSRLPIIGDASTGYEARGGLRWLALPWSGGGIELAGNVSYRDLDRAFATSANQWGWDAEARAHLARLLSFGVGFRQRGGDDETWIFNARLSL